jgi:hypothetical protein
MKYVIRAAGLVGRHLEAEMKGLSSPDINGCYLAAYDPDGHEGLGHAVWTPKLEEALMFPSQADAIALTQKQSTKVPLRGDGLPNKPLTAFNLFVEPAPS